MGRHRAQAGDVGVGDGGRRGKSAGAAALYVASEGGSPGATACYRNGGEPCTERAAGEGANAGERAVDDAAAQRVAIQHRSAVDVIRLAAGEVDVLAAGERIGGVHPVEGLVAGALDRQARTVCGDIGGRCDIGKNDVLIRHDNLSAGEGCGGAVDRQVPGDDGVAADVQVACDLNAVRQPEGEGAGAGVGADFDLASSALEGDRAAEAVGDAGGCGRAAQRGGHTVDRDGAVGEGAVGDARQRNHAGGAVVGEAGSGIDAEGTACPASV